MKLFIRAVPRTVTEEDIRPLFEEHGNVIEVALIRDRRSAEQQGILNSSSFYDHSCLFSGVLKG